MIKRFYIRYDRKPIYDTDDLLDFLDIAVRITNDSTFSNTITIIDNIMILTFIARNTYTNIPSDAFRRSVLNELLRT